MNNRKKYGVGLEDGLHLDMDVDLDTAMGDITWNGETIHNVPVLYMDILTKVVSGAIIDTIDRDLLEGSNTDDLP